MLSLETTTPQASGSNAKKVAACVTVAAALAVAGVAVGTSSSSKKSSKLALITVPEEFSGTFTHVHDNGSYRVDGKIHKYEHEDGDWAIDGHFVSKGKGLSDTYYHEYTLKDDYFIQETYNLTTDERIKVMCIEPAGMIHYGQGKDILKAAVTVTQDELMPGVQAKVQQKCAAGAELGFASENGMLWVLCGDYTEGSFNMEMIGEYSHAQVVAVEDMVVDVKFPEDFDLEANNCTQRDPITFFGDLVTKGHNYEHRALAPKKRLGSWPLVTENVKRRLPMTGYTFGHVHASDYTAWTAYGTSPFDCAAGQVRCIMFHGVANAGMNRHDMAVFDRYPEVRNPLKDIGTLGNSGVEDRHKFLDKGNKKGSVYGLKNFQFSAMDSCGVSYFADTETQIRGYSNYDLQFEFYHIIHNTGYHSDSCSMQLRIFTHSMANLVMSKGLIDGVILRRKFQWYQIQAPWYGSFGANKNAPTCALIRWLRGPATILAALAVIAIIIVTSVASGGAALALWIPIMTSVVGAAGLAGWILGPAKVFKDEVCIKGKYIGKNGLMRNQPYGLPANETISFHVPWTSAGIDNSTNSFERMANKRICGMYPEGTSTQYERSGIFKKIAKHLEHVAWPIITLADSSNGWDDSHQSAHDAGQDYKWGAGTSPTCTASGGCDGDGEMWSDGCVDASNCMASFQWTNDPTLLTDHFSILASNHDSGSCRSGWVATTTMATCWHLKQFIETGGAEQFDGHIGASVVDDSTAPTWQATATTSWGVSTGSSGGFTAEGHGVDNGEYGNNGKFKGKGPRPTAAG